MSFRHSIYLKALHSFMRQYEVVSRYNNEIIEIEENNTLGLLAWETPRKRMN